MISEAVIITLLLALKVSTERAGSSISGLIHISAANEHLEVLRLLLIKGARVDALTKSDNSNLHLVVEEKRRDCAHLLLANGAKPATWHMATHLYVSQHDYVMNQW
ncbi:hypothetical protein ACFE04_011315 [Oxalis oulophora]